MGQSAPQAVVQIFTNPGAGRRRAGRIEALVRAFEAEGARVLRSVSAGAPPQIAADTTHVCVAAGDGTVRHVAGAVVRSGRKVRLSIYPAGTINLLAREAGYPRRPRDFARLALAEGPARLHYPVAMGHTHFFACAGVGPDSLAVANVSPALKRVIGRFAYAVAFARLLARWPRHRIVLSAGDREIACEAFYLAKGRYYAGGWSFARQARVHEPVLHLVTLRTARRRDYLRFVVALAARRDVARLDNVETFSCQALRAEAAELLPLQADGDIVGTLPMEFAVADRPLAFC